MDTNHNGLVVPFPTDDTFVDTIPLSEHRAIVVTRRALARGTYASFRTWNRHREKFCWYPTKRGFVLPIQSAEPLATALLIASQGAIGQKPEWLLAFEETRRIHREIEAAGV